MVQFGIDNLLQQNPSWKSKRIALVTNHSATTNTLIPSRKKLVDDNFNIVVIFAPEHGLDVQGADGQLMHHGTDALTNLPIISLYGSQLQPSAKDLENIDIVLFDIPDIGCRYYTYLWTMTYVLEACAEHKKQFIVLDRPNPISGNFALAEGPMLDALNCSSFIGRWQIPLRHSCTMGELALYFNAIKKLQVALEVIRCNNWNRNLFQPQWGIDFVATSPAIKNFQAALLYPGLGLLEATNLSEGRGTDLSFQIAGAPWFDATIVCEVFNQIQEDVALKAVQFTPTESKYAHQLCNGVSFVVIDAAQFQPLFTVLLFIKLVKDIHANDFKWQTYPTHVNPTGKHHLDKLMGTANSEALFDLPFQSFLKAIEQATKLQNWENAMADYLLY